MIRAISKFGIRKRYIIVDNLIKKNFPTILTKMALEHFLEGFERGGYQTDASAGGWQKRKRNFEMKKRGRGLGNTPRSVRSSRALLVKTGDLRNSLRVISKRPTRMEVGTTGIKYAEIHNEGLMGKAFGKHTFKMPKREFIGESSKLERKITKRIEREIDKIFK